MRWIRPSASGFLEINLRVIKIILRVFKDQLAVGVGEFAALFGGDAGPEGAGRNDGVLGDDRSGGDDGTLADAGVVEDGDAHADEHCVFDDAAVDGGVVADGDPVADFDAVEVALAVEDGAILHVGVCADADGVDVAAQDGVHPDRGALAENNIAEDLGGEIDIATGGDVGQPPLVTANHFPGPFVVLNP